MRRKADLELELEDLRRQGTAVEQLSRQLRCYEAAIRLIEKHELWIEWAQEIEAIKSAALTSAQREGE